MGEVTRQQNEKGGTEEEEEEKEEEEGGRQGYGNDVREKKRTPHDATKHEECWRKHGGGTAQINGLEGTGGREEKLKKEETR